MANKINFQIGYSIDKNSVNLIRNSIQQLSNVQVGDIWGYRGRNLEVARDRLMQIRNISNELNTSLSRSMDPFLGGLNVADFGRELRNIGIDRLRSDLSYAGVTGQIAFKNIATEALTTNTAIKRTSQSLDKMATTIENTVRWAFSSAVMKSFTGSIQQAYGYIKNLDTSLNDIRIVTGKSSEEMADFAIQANKAAQALATNTTNYTRASLIYYQQGLSDEEVAARAETTLKAANVTQQSASAVSEQLTAVWNGYKVSAQEAELYVDRLAAVAAATASNLEELSIGMSKVASSAAAMGVGEEQLAAQLSTIIAVTRQAPESVGTALKTIYARMTDIEAGLDDEVSLGTYTEEMAQMGINVLDTQNKLRDMGEVIEEIGDKWKDFSREQQIALAQSMAGTRLEIGVA